MVLAGRSGLEALALYLATLWALYGQKDAGFKDKEMENIVTILSRKNQQGADRKAKGDALATLRQKRYDALLAEAAKRPGATKGRYDVGSGGAYAAGGKFRTGYEKLAYAR